MTSEQALQIIALLQWLLKTAEWCLFFLVLVVAYKLFKGGQP